MSQATCLLSPQTCELSPSDSQTRLAWSQVRALRTNTAGVRAGLRSKAHASLSVHPRASPQLPRRRPGHPRWTGHARVTPRRHHPHALSRLGPFFPPAAPHVVHRPITSGLTIFHHHTLRPSSPHTSLTPWRPLSPRCAVPESLPTTFKLSMRRCGARWLALRTTNARSLCSWSSPFIDGCAPDT